MGSRGRGRWVAAGLVVAIGAVLAGLVSAWRAGAVSEAGPGSAGPGAPAPAIRAVTRQDIAAVLPVTGTLGYAASYLVRGSGSGTLTWLPAAGQVIRQGQALYKIDNGTPVVLLYGTVPGWRALSPGVSGLDVSQLNHDLVRLGYASRADVAALGWDYYSWATAVAVQRLQQRLGVASPPGALSRGQVVFEPEALRVSQVPGILGGPAAGLVLAATSDRHVVTIPLDAAQQGEVATGNEVTVTLPDGASVPGVVSSVGTVAASPPGSGPGAAAVIPVQVTLAHPGAAGTLDQAPVTVTIVTGTARDVLAVPVSALLARSAGRYVVEIAGPGNSRRYVPVTPGIFDDSDGMVQVSGALTAGQRVVVAAT